MNMSRMSIQDMADLIYVFEGYYQFTGVSQRTSRVLMIFLMK